MACHYGYTFKTRVQTISCQRTYWGNPLQLVVEVEDALHIAAVLPQEVVELSSLQVAAGDEWLVQVTSAPVLAPWEHERRVDGSHVRQQVSNGPQQFLVPFKRRVGRALGDVVRPNVQDQGGHRVRDELQQLGQTFDGCA